MDPIKEAFFKIKEEISFLKEEIFNLKNQLKEIKTSQTYNKSQQYQQTDIQTQNQTQSGQNYKEESPYHQNYITSIGNEGVPTNKQTNKQTNFNAQNIYKSEFKQINEILDSLDDIKKSIRIKFKNLTPQEMIVFSTLYNIEDQNNNEITYKTIATQMKLSESSIRDYINKLIKKGVPIQKTRQNNKTILLNISKDLKKVVTLSAIQNLREL